MIKVFRDFFWENRDHITYLEGRVRQLEYSLESRENTFIELGTKIEELKTMINGLYEHRQQRPQEQSIPFRIHLGTQPPPVSNFWNRVHVTLPENENGNSVHDDTTEITCPLCANTETNSFLLRCCNQRVCVECFNSWFRQTDVHCPFCRSDIRTE